MRTLLLFCIFLSSLSAQSEVPGDQCLGGRLISIQQASITMKFNPKIITMNVAPDAEIWRRGVDLESIHQLVVGDEIYLKCTRAADGTVVASMIAAAEKDDGVDLVPHHIVESRYCGGYLVTVTKDTLSVKNDYGTCVIHLKADAEIWRGEIFHETSALKLGDVIDANAMVVYPSEELIAEEVFANITITEGTIVSIRSDRIVVDQYPGAGKSAYPRGHVTVLYDRRTEFDLSAGELRKGMDVRAIGLDLGRNTFRATSIVIER
jgi:hypothetical protein